MKINERCVCHTIRSLDGRRSQRVNQYVDGMGHLLGQSGASLQGGAVRGLRLQFLSPCVQPAWEALPCFASPTLAEENRAFLAESLAPTMRQLVC